MDLEKLMMSKAIMDRHNTIGRGQVPDLTTNTMVENFNMPNARYNINPEMLSETPQMPVSIPSPSNTAGFTKPSVDAIKKSKLPDEIKKLMMEHPIEQPGQSNGPTLSDALVEKASRLMGTKKPQTQHTQQPIMENTNLRDMLKDVVREVLRENGMLTESVEKTNDKFIFKVGSHVFEGRLTKVKKMS
jgi:hypothetical protein